MTSSSKKDFVWGLAKEQEREEGESNDTGAMNFCSGY